MKRTTAIAISTLVALSLVGCTSEAPEAVRSTPTASETPISADEIATTEEGIAWARSLDDDVDADELATGIRAIGDTMSTQDIWFDTSNDINTDLISLNAEVLANPEDAGDRVADLNEIVDDLEAAIEKGNQP